MKFRSFLVASFVAFASLLLSHPAVAQHGETNGMPQAPPSGSAPDPDVPAGTLVVEVADASGNPVPDARVTVTESFESVADGNREKRLEGKSTGPGVEVFGGLDTALRYSYLVRVEYQGGRYELAPFRAEGGVGRRARVTVFPSTTSPRDAFVGMRGFVFVQLREDGFHFDVLYRVFSMGQRTWLPTSVEIELPKGFSAVDSQKVGDTHFVATDRGARLEGSFPPGQKDVRLTFTVPSRNEEAETFSLTTPPHVAELRVLAEAVPGMTMAVPGFEAVERTAGPEGGEVLITRRLADAGSSSFGPVTIELGGLPVVGPERWYAVFLGLLLAGGALVLALFGKKGPDEQELELDRNAARAVLLDDLTLLEAARERGEVGPSMYRETRRQLLDAVARLEPIS